MHVTSGELKGKTVAVTGGAGVLGRALIRQLLLEGAQVKYLDKRRLSERELAKRATFIEGDILDEGPVRTLVEDSEVVFHLAAKMPQARLDKAGFHRINVEATMQVFEASKKAGVRRFVFASTTEVYGAQHIERPLKEDDPKVFTGEYSRNKFEVEQAILKDGGIEACAFRMPMIFGPGFYHEKAILATFWLLKLGLPVPVPAPQALSSFVSARDAAAGLVLGAVRKEAVGLPFNLAAKDTPRMEDFFRSLIEAIPSRSKIVRVSPERTKRTVAYARKSLERGKDKIFLGTPAELVPFIETGGAYSIERAQNLLGFSPQDSTVDAWLTAYRWFFALPFKERTRVMFVDRV